MESISAWREYLLTIHGVRKSAGEKESFRVWVMGELKKAGWRAHAESYGKWNGSVNVIAGDPDKAELFLCAHYDTGSRMLAPGFCLSHQCGRPMCSTI